MDHATSKRAKKIWFFTTTNQRSRNKASENSRRAKIFLYETLYKNITQHNLLESYKLIRLLPKDTTLDPYILFRIILILIESVDHEKVNKNFIIYLESILGKLDLLKPDVFVEFLAYFIRNNRIDDARELFAHRHRFMAHRTHRQLTYVKTNLSCYEFLMNYLSWEDKMVHQETKFDVSIQGWIVNAIDQLKNISGNYEYFVMCITRVLLTYKYYRKAYLFVSQFQINNPDNISAQLLLFNLLAKLATMAEDEKLQIEDKNQIQSMACDPGNENECMQTREDELTSINNFSLDGETISLSRYPIARHKRHILINLRRLDKTREEILELEDELSETRVELIRDLMDSLEHIEHIKDLDRWKYLRSIISEVLDSGDEQAIEAIRSLWQTRYQKFWSSVNFLSLVDDGSSSLRKLVKKVMKRLRSNFNSKDETSHEDPECDVEFEEFDVKVEQGADVDMVNS